MVIGQAVQIIIVRQQGIVVDVQFAGVSFEEDESGGPS
jgi:hypothetical protein